MTKINTEYSRTEPATKALCWLKVGDFFRMHDDSTIYRYVAYCDSTSAYVISLDDLTMSPKSSTLQVYPVKISEITIKVDFNE